MVEPIARSPISPAPPVTTHAGWEVSARCSVADPRIADCTPLAKVLVQASENGAVAGALGVRSGRAARDPHGTLVTGSGPGEWTLFAPTGTALEVAGRVEAAADGERMSVVDVTHGRALMRVTGERTTDLLSKVCGIDLSDDVTPDGAAFRSSVARLVTDVVRDDQDGVRSYLLHCERSYGQYLFDSLLDAGEELGVEVEGFTASAEREKE